MSKYYYLISGLPDITLEDTKRVYSVLSFKKELLSSLSGLDQKLLEIYFLKFDNRNLLNFLLKKNIFDERGNLTLEEIESLYIAIKTEEAWPVNKKIPNYFPEFIKQFVTEFENDKDKADSTILWDDRLEAMYYTKAMHCHNKFMAQWFEFNLNINNLLVAINCRKYNLDKNQYIIPSNDFAELILSSNARDFDIGEDIDYYPDLIRIAEEPDLMMREKKIDSLKWLWLDEQTLFRTFDFENIFTYLLRIEMIERWINLDKIAGEQHFREMVRTIKQESAEVLSDFKKNNIK